MELKLKCPYCGGEDIIKDVKIQKSCETGSVCIDALGKGKIFRRIKAEPLYCDLCKDCGSVVRLHINGDPNQDWDKD